MGHAGVGPPPDDMGPGQTWDAKVTILQHGNPETPLMGVVPTMTIRNGSVTKTFEGTETDLAGVSTIKVVFPSSESGRTRSTTASRSTAARRRTSSRL